MDLGASRLVYQKGALRRSDLDPDPLTQFGLWYTEAVSSGLREPNAMTLATATASGRVSARMVLLKGYDPDGFLFYTNYESRKGRELAENPRAALVFYWDALERQVRVEGSVERLDPRVSEAYFRSRPLGSRLGAWASPQSRAVRDREELAERLRAAERRFEGREPPLPPFWGGYRVRPDAVELWQGRPDRLHDRFRYTLVEDGWRLERLAP